MQALIEFLQTFWTNLQNGQLPELGYWNYFILSFLIVLNGPAATLLGGAAAAAGLLRPQYVYLAGMVGNLIADIFWYNVGARGKTNWILKRGQRLGVRQKHLDKLSEGMDQHAIKFLLMAKISIGLAVPTLLVAGITKVSWKKWFPTVFIGEAVWTGLLVLVGYFATEALKQVEQGLEAVALIFTILVLGGMFMLIQRALQPEDSTAVEERP